MLTHVPRDLLGRQGQLVIDPERKTYYFYDSTTAFLCQLDPRLGKSVADSDEPSVAVTELYLDAAKVLTALEMRTHEGHLESALKAEPMNTIALGVEAGCNLACTYCYNDSHYERPQFQPAITGMTLETALQAVDKALHELTPGSRLTVQLIGGEPLLQFPMIRELIPRAEQMGRVRGCDVRFGMNTNGLGLTREVTEFLIEHRVGVAISIDGTRRQHDRHRTFRDGRGSYDVLVARIEQFMQRFKEASPIRTARITASSPNFDFVEAVEHVRGLGFNNIGIGIALGTMLSQAGGDTARADDEQRPRALALPLLRDGPGTKREVIDGLIEGFSRLKSYCLEQYQLKNLFRISLFNDTMFTLYAYRPKYTPCGAQRRYVGVSPNGDVVPCHRYIGTTDPSRVFGSVCDDAVNRLATEERARHVPGMQFLTVLDDRRDDAYSCSTCWARHLCGGECYEVKEALGDNFHENKPYMCDLKRALYQMGIDLLIALGENRAILTELMEMNAVLKPNELAGKAVKRG
jgi:uncharacterized protein